MCCPQNAARKKTQIKYWGFSRESDAYYNATTGQRLKPELVKVARGVEMEYFQDKNVYTKRPRAEAFARMGKAPSR